MTNFSDSTSSQQNHHQQQQQQLLLLQQQQQHQQHQLLLQQQLYFCTITKQQQQQQQTDHLGQNLRQLSLLCDRYDGSSCQNFHDPNQQQQGPNGYEMQLDHHAQQPQWNNQNESDPQQQIVSLNTNNNVRNHHHHQDLYIQQQQQMNNNNNSQNNKELHYPALITQPGTQTPSMMMMTTGNEGTMFSEQQQRYLLEQLFAQQQQPLVVQQQHHLMLTNQQQLHNLSLMDHQVAVATQQQQQQQVTSNSIPQQVYTVQDRLPHIQPVYNGINPNYPGLRIIHTNPPIFIVDNFLSSIECQFLIDSAQDSFSPAPVVGKGSGEVSPSRTSSTCYIAREDVPYLMNKVQTLIGKPIEHCELPQVGRYFLNQQYYQHFDAFDLSNEDGCRFASNGGQRIVTVLIYLNTVQNGGGTRFPSILLPKPASCNSNVNHQVGTSSSSDVSNILFGQQTTHPLEIQPVQGQALVFFPATVDGYLDRNALHAAMPAIDTKYVSQIWIRQSRYDGTPSKRLPRVLDEKYILDMQQHQQQQSQHPPFLFPNNTMIH